MTCDWPGRKIRPALFFFFTLRTMVAPSVQDSLKTIKAAAGACRKTSARNALRDFPSGIGEFRKKSWEIHSAGTNFVP
jgi:hypothetical protein